MINNVSQITSPYSKTAPKVNDVSTLDAREWDNISAAVETAHQKINSIITSGKVKDLEAHDSDSISISTEGSRDSIMDDDGKIQITTYDSSIILCSTNTSEVSDGTRDIILQADGGAKIDIQSDSTETNGSVKIAGNLKVLGDLLHSTYIPSGQGVTETVDSCSIADIITVVNYFKTNNSTGPFASAA